MNYVDNLYNNFSDNIYDEYELFELLKDKNLKISAAESCTGGLVSSKIVNIAGVSDFYLGGFVTYSNDAKIKFCRVNKITLAIKGAVSPETAAQMCRGAARAFASEVAISTTGIAGPGGGSPKKPVGLVYIGCYVNGLICVKKCNFKGDRLSVREQSAAEAINFAYKCIKKYS